MKLTVGVVLLVWKNGFPSGTPNGCGARGANWPLPDITGADKSEAVVLDCLKGIEF